MKNSLLTVLLLLSANISLVCGQSLQAYVDQKIFYLPDGKAAFEVYIQINSQTVAYEITKPGFVRSKVLVTEIIRKGEKDIVDFRKQEVQSTEMLDTALIDFIDQQRFVLEPGNYFFDIEIIDMLKKDAKPAKVTKEIVVLPKPDNISFSNIQLIENYKKSTAANIYTKSGLDIMPFVTGFYPPEFEKIAFYAEIYQSDKTFGNDGKFTLMQYIENNLTGTRMSGFEKATRYIAKDVVPVISYIDIAELPTGDYDLILEIRNRNNETVAREKVYFQRLNTIVNLSIDDILKLDISATFVEKINNPDSLKDYIYCLVPIAQDLEREIILKQIKAMDMKAQKQFFYSFWKSRNNTNPEESWYTYREQVNYVNKIFSTSVRRGYETDRGRIYLKYGAPNQVTDRPNEPSSYPYQIWQYYKIGNFNNKIFVFYLPDLVTNDYQLLHSDMIGEIRNYRWEYMLNVRNTPNVNVDSPDGGGTQQWGGNSNIFFRNPR